VLLLDAGVWVAVVDPEDRYHSSSRSLVTTSILPVATLDLTLYEVTNVLSARKQQHDLGRRVCRVILERCGDHVARADAQLAEETVPIITEYGITAYDASYVAMARRYDWTLISTDIKDLVSRGLALAPDDPAIG
jgi:predicted nucleic acid-binding protein